MAGFPSPSTTQELPVNGFGVGFCMEALGPAANRICSQAISKSIRPESPGALQGNETSVGSALLKVSVLPLNDIVPDLGTSPPENIELIQGERLLNPSRSSWNLIGS